MADLHAHEAGNGGQGQGRPTVHAVLFYSESCAIAFYEKVIKVKADVAAYLINCFPSAYLRW